MCIISNKFYSAKYNGNIDIYAMEQASIHIKEMDSKTQEDTYAKVWRL